MERLSAKRVALTCMTTAVTGLNLIGITPAFAQSVSAPATTYSEPTITNATSTTSYGATSPYVRSVSSMTSLTPAQKLALLQQNIKYVFVIFQENRSFDHYFGTYPGANGLTSTYPGANPSDPLAQPANQLPSYNSVIANVDGSYSTITPWLEPRSIVNTAGNTVFLYPEDILSVDHSHTGYIADMHADLATKTITQNDGYPLDQEKLQYSTNSSGTTAPIVSESTGSAPTSAPNLQTKQKGEVVISHLDCDTIPFLWQYADRFTLFDNMHQTAVGPSTPNAIAMIAGQTGDTQWAKHPSNVNSSNVTYGKTGKSVVTINYSLPNETDTPPFPGSASDTAAVLPPYGPDEASNGSAQTGPYAPDVGQITLTFASLPLSFMGNELTTIIRSDQHVATDLIDVPHDMQTIQAKDPNVNWGWYQQGYGPEPFDGMPIDSTYNAGGTGYTAAPEHASYIVHHNGPQYFGYLGDNTVEQGKMHSLAQFFTDVSNANLGSGGVFYIRGGYYNNDSLTPADPNASVKGLFPGNDDHGSYSDSQISEALVADEVNAIANSPYWNQSAIIITYDESDGFYDHQPESFRTWGPDGQPESGGPRIPLIVVSPFATTHAVSHVYSEHSAVIKFIEELNGLIPLGSLPDEAAAFTTGAQNCTTQPASAHFCAPNGSPQSALGPADVAAGMGDLTEAFDNDRLLGNIPTLPSGYATIPASVVHTLPHYSATAACQNPALAITPTDYPNGYAAGAESDPPPLDFNPRPTVSLGSPYYNTSGNTTSCPVVSGVVTPNSACLYGSGTGWAN
jgi:phospholipase C